MLRLLGQKQLMILLQQSLMSKEPPKSMGSLNTVVVDFQLRNIRIDSLGKQSYSRLEALELSPY